MASNMIGNLSVSLTMNTAAFQKGASLAEKRAETLGARMKGIGNSVKAIGAGLAVGFAASGLTEVIGNAFELGSSLTEASAKVGVTVEALQEMRYVAEQNGVSIETMDASLNKMSKTLGNLQLGNKATAETFKALGLSAKEFVGLSPTESFSKIAEALKQVKDETVRAALGNQIFGRSYAELKPIVDLGAAGIAAAAEEKRKDGLISTEEAKQLDYLADSWSRLKTNVGVATAKMIAATASFFDFLGPKLQPLNDSIMAFNDLWFRIGVNIPIYMQKLYTGVKTWLGDKLTAVLNGVKAKVEAVGQYFFELYDAVVGNSYVPDMVDGIRDQMARLDAVMVGPAQKATSKTSQAFLDLQEKVQPLLDTLFPEIRKLLDYKADQNTLEQWAKAGKLSVDELQASLERLRDKFFGVDGPIAVTQEGGPLTDIVDTLPAIGDAAKNTAKSVEVSNVRVVKSYADTAKEVLGSISGLANSIKSGGFIGILEGVANLFLTLAGAGAFGGKIQARANAPAGRARGGNVTSNRSYLVGERGPEIFSTNRPGFITANNDIGAGAGRAARVEIIPSPFFNVVVDGRADSRVASASPGIASAAAQGVQTNIAQGQFRSLP
jgi:hypothetical protein